MKEEANKRSSSRKIIYIAISKSWINFNSILSCEDCFIEFLLMDHIIIASLNSEYCIFQSICFPETFLIQDSLCHFPSRPRRLISKEKVIDCRRISFYYIFKRVSAWISRSQEINKKKIYTHFIPILKSLHECKVWELATTQEVVQPDLNIIIEKNQISKKKREKRLWMIPKKFKRKGHRSNDHYQDEFKQGFFYNSEIIEKEIW